MASPNSESENWTSRYSSKILCTSGSGLSWSGVDPYTSLKWVHITSTVNVFDQGDFCLYCFLITSQNPLGFSLARFVNHSPSNCLYLAVSLNFVVWCFWRKECVPDCICSITKKSITCLITCFFSLRNTLHWAIYFLLFAVFGLYTGCSPKCGKKHGPAWIR